MHEPRAVRQARAALCEGCERGRVDDRLSIRCEVLTSRVVDQRAHYLDDSDLLRARNESCAQL
eukprot:6452543-Prymnesium_polylepis.1